MKSEKEGGGGGGGFIGLKAETPQNGVVLVTGSLKRCRFGGVVLKK